MAKPHLRSPHPRQYDSRPSRDMAESLVASYPPEEPHSAIIDLRAFEPWWYREGGREWYMDRLYHKSNRLYNSALRFCAAPGNGLLDVWEFLSKRLPACCYGSMEGWWIVGCDPEGCFCKTEYLRAKCPVGPHCVYYTEQYLYYWWRAQRALERIDALIERGQIFVSQAFDDERWDDPLSPGQGRSRLATAMCRYCRSRVSFDAARGDTDPTRLCPACEAVTTQQEDEQPVLVRADAHKRPSTAKQRARQEEAIVLANLEWASIDWYRLTKPEPIALPAPMIDGMEYGWVAPDGSAYACSYRGHAELQWALECHEGVENLEHAGWAALRSTCTGDGMPAWDLPDHPTASQIGTILEWSHQRGIAPPAGIDDPQHADTMLNPLVRRKRRPGERPDGD